MAILAVDELMLREPRLLVPGKKPLGPVKIDRRHWLGSRMGLAFLFSPAMPYVDLVSGRIATRVGNPSLVVKKGEACCDFGGAADGLQIPLDLSETSEVTIIANICPDAWVSSGYNMITEHTADGLGTSGGISLFNQSGGNAINDGHKISSAVNVRNAIGRPTENVWTQIITVHNTANGATTETAHYQNAVAIAGTLTQSGDSSGNFASSTFNIGCRNGASLWFDGGFSYLFVIRKALVLNEISEVFRNPFEAFVPA